VLPAGEEPERWEAEWFGLGTEESWPDRRVATWAGRHRLPLTALHHPRVRPQTTGHRSDLRELTVHRPDGVTLGVRTLEGRPGFTLAPWAPHELQVPHHDALPASTSWHLHLDLAQHGIGPRSCGPDVRPEHQLRPGPVSAALRFRIGRRPAADCPPTPGRRRLRRTSSRASARTTRDAPRAGRRPPRGALRRHPPAWTHRDRCQS